jgi:hypothetical protein
VHVTVAQVSTGAEPIETARIVAEEMHLWLRELQGFEGFMMLSREGTTLAVTFWSSMELAESHSATRAQFREKITSVAGVELVEVQEYQMMFGELGPLHLA